jgi:hypothetical protein
MKTKYIFPVLSKIDEMYHLSQEQYLKERARFWNISEDCVPEVMRLINEGVPLTSENAIELYEKLNFGFGSLDAHGITLKGDGYEHVSKKEPEDWFLLEEIIKSLKEQETATEEQISAVEGFYTDVQGSDIPEAHK